MKDTIKRIAFAATVGACVSAYMQAGNAAELEAGLRAGPEGAGVFVAGFAGPVGLEIASWNEDPEASFVLSTRGNLRADLRVTLTGEGLPGYGASLGYKGWTLGVTYAQTLTVMSEDIRVRPCEGINIFGPQCVTGEATMDTTWESRLWAGYTFSFDL